MFRYIRQRILFAILTLFIITFVVFVLVSAFGPSPIKSIVEKELQDPKNKLTFDELMVMYEKQFGLRDAEGNPISIIARYFRYLGGAFRGDFGFVINKANNPSPSEYTNIQQLFFIPLRYSIRITLPAFIISSIVGTTIGVFAGYKRGKLFDSAANIFVLLFIAIPSFVLAPILITISLKIGIPATIPRDALEPTFGELFVSYLPPILIITLASMAVYVSYTRNQVITVLTSNYVLIAKTKGLNARQIFFKYVLRNISIPLFNLLLGSFLGLLSGSIIIEKYWDVPGTSQIIARSFPTGEINIIMFSTIFFTGLSLLADILADVMYAVLDPKITFATKSKKNYWLFFKAYLERRKLAKDLFNKQKNQLQNQQISKND
ncbi:ABC transporter permease [Metamycoplasma alkalescens]|uniref:Oligopeptide transport system permease protein n=3 Tax=Metamycoplasma alkalescens TaxID=45363 RepID=N9U0L8_9BACT|nr:ABC transporter permease [Metamycoplasma alkalescens]ENY54097.1 Oligopeptide transport system permease protein [Metamycoplasma alkalescens 14918]PYF43581.1 oligopeptide transport system permease protein [Metamycoplasma alkalescens]